MPLEFRGPHLEFLQDRDTENKCLEGARMSGKSWLVIAAVLDWCVDFPGMEWLCCRYAGEETKTKLRTEIVRVSAIQGIELKWNADEQAYSLPEKNGKVSKIFCYGLKTQTAAERLAKIRGLNVAGVLVDQTEELPIDIAEELVFAKRQPGYPHQLIYSPNPVTEDNPLADMFPEDNSIPGRKHYRVSLYDNAHNLTEKTIQDLEKMYPPTHAKYKSLILGQRGVNVVGTPVYDGVFSRKRHFGPTAYDETRPLVEAFQYGQHHPSYLVAQRTYWGGIRVLAAIMGKRMFLEDFLPIVKQYRSQWFPQAVFKTCCDPPPAVGAIGRYTNVATLKTEGFHPSWRVGSNSPDVREAVIQSIASCMRSPAALREGFTLSDDPTRFLMASKDIIKQHKFVVDGLESGYVWSDHHVSVGNKLVRQPRADEWVDGAQRCLENIWLNFCADTQSDFDRDRDDESGQGNPSDSEPVSTWC